MANDGGSDPQPMVGSLDDIRNGLICGWIICPDRPSEAVHIRIRVNQAIVADLVADVLRPDLVAAGMRDGRHGFALTGKSAALPPEGCLVTVEHVRTGQIALSGRVAPTASVRSAPQAVAAVSSEVTAAVSDGTSKKAPEAYIEGNLDVLSFERATGWAWYPDRPFEAVRLRILADDEVIARTIANIHRPDVELAGYGTGRYGFDLTTEFHPPVRPCLIKVEDDATGAALTLSPRRLEAPLQLDGPSSNAIAALFESPGTDDALLARAEFAACHADRLLQRLSESQSHRTARAARRARKWRWRAEDGLEPAGTRPRALVIDHALPRPGHDAGSHAILSHMASLRRLGFDILFVPADMRSGPGAQSLAEMGIDCATGPWCASVEEVMRREATEFDLVYIHRYEQAMRYVNMARHYMPQARRLYCVADLYGLRLSRQGQVEERPDLVAHANIVGGLEINAAAGCHVVVTHSPVEAAILCKVLPRDRVEVVPWHVPTLATRPSFDERRGIAFIGSYSHAPNLDAALWLRDHVLPLVWEVEPELVCTLAGTDMPATLARSNDRRVRAVGRVAVLSDLLSQVRMTVAPLAYGAGLKGKVLDSLAMGVPCVCSPISAEGFALPSPLRELVAADAAGFAAAIIRLHRDPELFAACRKAGLAYTASAFSEAVVDAGLRRAAGLPAIPAALQHPPPAVDTMVSKPPVPV